MQSVVKYRRSRVVLLGLHNINRQPRTILHVLAMKTKLIQLALVISAVAAILFVASSGTALARPATDLEGDSSDPNFDIKTYGFKGDMIFVQVYGKTARTLPAGDHQGFAYVFNTNDGIWAINGHKEAHSTDLPQWHAERIFADGTCIQGIDIGSEQALIIAGNNAMIRADGVSEIYSVASVEFHLLVDEPDNPPPGTDCIAEVVNVFDEA